MRVTFVGHATVLLEIDGVRLLTDPALAERLGPLRAAGPIRRVSAALDPDLLGPIDAVLVSHAHADHLDLPTLRALPGGPRIIVSERAGDFVRAAGLHHVEELRQGATTQVGGLTIRATHAAHTGFRPPFGPRSAAVGYLIESATRRVYFAGDTDLFPSMAALAPDLFLALLPVWGWGPRLGPGHMDPGRAATALELLRPRVAVPIHWGTFWPMGLGRVRQARLVEPPREFVALARETTPQVRVHVALPGSDAFEVS